MKSFWQRAPRHKRFYKGPARSKKYLAWIRTLPCLICGQKAEAAHTGRDGGASLKSSDFSAVPLCQNCHTQAGKSYHRGTREQFEKRYGIDLAAIARNLKAHYERRTMPNYEPVLRRQQAELFDPLELEDDIELECECVQVDVDEWSARYCPAHGPNSPAAREARASEAAEEFAYWNAPGWAEVLPEPQRKAVQSVKPASEEAA